MYYTIRLYSPHDIDLIELLYRNDYNLPYDFSRAVYSYVRGEDFKVIVPKSELNPSYVRHNPHILKFYVGDDDIDIQDFITNLRDRYRNALLKSIFRYMCDKPYLLYGEEPKVSEAPKVKRKRNTRAKNNDLHVEFKEEVDADTDAIASVPDDNKAAADMLAALF